MKLLNRYILKKYLLSFLFFTGASVVIIILVHYINHSHIFARQDVSWSQTIGYYQSYSIFMANLVAPIAVFISTVYVTGKLAQHTEIIAMLSSGISFTRIMRPFFIGAMIIATLNFLLSGWVMPYTSKSRIDFEIKYMQRASNRTTRNIHLQVGKSKYSYIEYYNYYSNKGMNFTLEVIKEGKLKEKLSAGKIIWKRKKNEWRLEKWERRIFEGLEERIERGESLDLELNMSPRDFSVDPLTREGLSLTELEKHINKLKAKGADNIRSFLTEKYIRYMCPFGVIIVASRKMRRGVALQLTIGLGLALIYIAFYYFSKGIASSSNGNVLLIVWFPNIVFTILSAAFYRLVPK